jgi:membrane protein YdbS with pleckstrin-like domain
VRQTAKTDYVRPAWPARKQEGRYRSYLISGERLLWESRPSLVWMLAPPFVAGLIFIVLAELVLGENSGVFAQWIILAICLAVAVAVVRRVIRWWVSYYVVTSLRIISSEGGWRRRQVDLPISTLQSVVLEDTLIGRFFEYGSLQLSSASMRGVVSWDFVSYPTDVRGLIEDVRHPDRPVMRRVQEALARGGVTAAPPVAASVARVR